VKNEKAETVNEDYHSNLKFWLKSSHEVVSVYHDYKQFICLESWVFSFRSLSHSTETHNIEVESMDSGT
jgi:hypothetical protein